MPLLHLPLPSLIVLDVVFKNTITFENSRKSFPKHSPNISELSICMLYQEGGFTTIEPDYISRWQNLCSLDLPHVALGVDALVHLSRMPALSRLSCTLSDTLPASDSPLSFYRLYDLQLQSQSLELISRILSWTQLPAITRFYAHITRSPSRREVSSFIVGISTSNSSHIIEHLTLDQFYPCIDDPAREDDLWLGFEDLRPWMAFSNLSQLDLNINGKVTLTDNQLLELASAWPKLAYLLINLDYGWKSHGITPGGLVRLLQTCRSLSQLALVLDTRGYTKVPPDQDLASLGWTFSHKLSIGVLDSAIEAESVPALATFFAGLAACCGFLFRLETHSDRASSSVIPNAEEHTKRWDDVRRRAQECGF